MFFNNYIPKFHIYPYLHSKISKTEPFASLGVFTISNNTHLLHHSLSFPFRSSNALFHSLTLSLSQSLDLCFWISLHRKLEVTVYVYCFDGFWEIKWKMKRKIKTNGKWAWISCLLIVFCFEVKEKWDRKSVV